MSEEEKYNTINESEIIYRPKNYPGPIAINATLSKEAEEYLKSSKVQINITDDKTLSDELN